MKKVQLSEVCDISSGGTPSRKNSEFFNGEIPWAKISDIENADNGVIHNTEEHISTSGLKNIRGKLFPKGTLLFAMYGSIGKVAICGRELSTNQAILGIRPKGENEIDLGYLKTWFASNKQKLINQGRGVALKNLSATIIRDLEIDLPPYNDQIRIAHLLGKVEGLIAQRKQHLQQLDDLLKSVFLEMFGDPVRNEKGWETTELEHLCEQVIDCPHSTPVYSDEPTGYYCVRSGDIVDGYLDLTKTLQVERQVYEKRIKRYIPKTNDVVYSREGGRLGNAARVLGVETICLGQRIMLFKAGVENSAEFLWALLESRPFKTKLRGLVGGGAAPRVNIKDLKNIIVIKPAPYIQTKFSEIVKHVDTVKSFYQQSLTDLESLYGALSQQAFKGELDLSRVPLPENDVEEREGKLEENLIQLHEKFKVLPEIQKTLETLGQNSPEFEKVMAVARKASEAVSFASELPIIPEFNESIIAAQKVLKPLNMPQFTQLQEVSDLSKRVSDVFKALGLPVQSNQLSQSYIQSIEAARKVTEQFKLPKWMEANTKLVDNLIPKSMQRQLELIERSAEGFENEGQTENEDNEKKEYKLLSDEEIFSQLAPEFESFLVDKKGEILNLDDFWNRAVIQNLLSNDEEGNKWGPLPPTDLEFWRKTGSLKLYDKVKSYIFDAINDKKVSQKFNIEKNMIELRIVN
ncbi:restriction endonuclease subunit S [Thalassolituus sp.]|jgi:type I restriction enzyme S subunit|uniref:restriction endonuclease subunit S n=1 Tax=Thalassolituus sp. TaxID=2030822 RepID=UPI0032D9614D